MREICGVLVCWCFRVALHMASDAVRTEEIVVAEVSEELLRSQQETIEAGRIAAETQQVGQLLWLCVCGLAACAVGGCGLAGVG